MGARRNTSPPFTGYCSGFLVYFQALRFASLTGQGGITIDRITTKPLSLLATLSKPKIFYKSVTEGCWGWGGIRSCIARIIFNSLLRLCFLVWNNAPGTASSLAPMCLWEGEGMLRVCAVQASSGTRGRGDVNSDLLARNSNTRTSDMSRCFCSDFALSYASVVLKRTEAYGAL
jgi:hypothetical protein